MIVHVMKLSNKIVLQANHSHPKYLNILDFAYSAQTCVMFSKKTNDYYMSHNMRFPTMLYV